jgi:hypothetical protein
MVVDSTALTVIAGLSRVRLNRLLKTAVGSAYQRPRLAKCKEISAFIPSPDCAGILTDAASFGAALGGGQETFSNNLLPAMRFALPETEPCKAECEKC